MATFLFIVWVLSLLMGFISLGSYMVHPLTAAGLTTYTGKKFWLVFFILSIVFYFKGPTI